MGQVTARGAFIWGLVLAVIVAAVGLAAFSPFLAWRDATYIAAGFAGIVALALILIQLMLATEMLPGLETYQARRAHRLFGMGLVVLVTAHVGGLWITSPPDVVDALLLASPTPFSVWGVVAMWAVFVTALLAGMRQRLRLRFRFWRFAHGGLGMVIAVGTVIHALLIEGAMEVFSKGALSLLTLTATAAVLRMWWHRAQPPASR